MAVFRFPWGGSYLEWASLQTGPLLPYIRLRALDLRDIAFNVYRSTTSPVPIDAGHRIASGLTETEYTDCGRYKNYYYAVTAVNAEGESEPSNEAQASEPCGSAMAMTLTESGEYPSPGSPNLLSLTNDPTC